MNSIKFRIAAKTDVGIVRENNEDNFQASSDLSIEPMRWVNNEICSLGEKGALLVVADGMGGMNAGEVASQIAIDTVRAAFSPGNLTNDIMSNRFSIEKFMNSVIIEADKRIKSDAKSHPESRGMGTTIVIGWLLKDKLYISWCGDSRAYIYNPQAGLHQISKDHSYVQTLVDRGILSKEEAFDYPESNIITRCLGDSSTKAKPESLLQPYEVCDNDIIILCTDGLSGMIRDGEIESIIRKNEHNMDVCSDELIRAACDAEGADNITICMCQILQGAKVCDPNIFEMYDTEISKSKKISTRISNVISTKIDENKTRWKKVLSYGIIICLLFAIVLGSLYKMHIFNPSEEYRKQDETLREDSTQTTNVPDSTHNSNAESNGNNVNTSQSNSSIRLNPEEKNKPNGIKDVTTGKQTGKLKREVEPQKVVEELTPVKVDTTYVVEEGDNLFSIARKFEISVEDIKKWNKSIDENSIKPGEKLKLYIPKRK